MLRIRLMRMGSRKNPHYRVVVVDSQKRRGGAYVESLGHYDPRNTVAEPLSLNAERVKYWIGQGAQPSEVVVKLLEKIGVEVPAGVIAKRSKTYTARPHA
jgi:small subunit ribosomal protein S16